MKAIIIAGGDGTRLYPMNCITNKHLLPICDRPVIFYSMGLLMESGIIKFIIVIKRADYQIYLNLLGKGENLGIQITYVFQDEALGIADALYRCKDYIHNRFIVMLGDNFFNAGDVVEVLRKQIVSNLISEEMFMFSVPCSNSVVATSAEFTEDGKVTKLLFKEKNKSNTICPGMYIYGRNVFDRIEKLAPSKRNELEIIDLNRMYLADDKLKIIPLSEDTIWLDLGSMEDRILAENYVYLIEKSQGKKIACLEEIAIKNKWVTVNSINQIFESDKSSSYINYIKKIEK